jgi:hypothetical protein
MSVDLGAPAERSSEIYGYAEGKRAPTQVAPDTLSAARISEQTVAGAWHRYGSSKVWHFARERADGSIGYPICNAGGKTVDAGLTQSCDGAPAGERLCFKCVAEATGHEGAVKSFVRGRSSIKGGPSYCGVRMECKCGVMARTNESGPEQKLSMKRRHTDHILREFSLDNSTDEDNQARHSARSQLSEDRLAWLDGLKVGDQVALTRYRDAKDDDPVATVTHVTYGDMPLRVEHPNRYSEGRMIAPRLDAGGRITSESVFGASTRQIVPVPAPADAAAT